MNKQLALIFTDVELIKNALESGEATEVKRIFTEQLSNDAATELRKKANLITAQILNCNFITDIDTAREAIQAYDSVHKQHFAWQLVREL